MRYRKLSQQSALSVSVVALGTMSVAAGSMHASVDEQQADETIRAAIEAGVNFIDTAPAYGNGESEERLGRALKRAGINRDRLVLATKASGKTLARAEILADCEASLRRLQTSHIDLYQIHWPHRVVPLEETLDAMRTLRDQGKVRAIGVCNFGPSDLADANVAKNGIIADQVAYSLLARGVEYGLAERCKNEDVGILCYSPLAQGLLSGKYTAADQLPPDRCRSRHFAGTRPGSRHGEAGCESQLFEAIRKIGEIASGLHLSVPDLSIAWLLHQPAVASVLCGASTPQQARDNVRAAAISLSPQTLADLDAATAEVKTHLGANLDMWQGSGNSRIR